MDLPVPIPQNSGPITKKKMPRGRPFQPGVSANPGGRPKMSEDVREAFRALTPAAIKTLGDLVTNGRTENVRLQAASIILDRFYGKPTQPICGDASADPVGLKIIVEVVD